METPGIKWRAAAHTSFAHKAPGASVSMNGLLGFWKAEIEGAVANGEAFVHVPKSNGPIPDNFDSATAFPKCATMINDIRDQSNCGCCWAFGGAEAASDRMCIASNASLVYPLSAQDVASARRSTAAAARRSWRRGRSSSARAPSRAASTRTRARTRACAPTSRSRTATTTARRATTAYPRGGRARLSVAAVGQVPEVVRRGRVVRPRCDAQVGQDDF